MKKLLLISLLTGLLALNSPAQFTFIHLSDIHASSIPFEDADTNAQYFRGAIREFAALQPKPAFVVVSGDVSNVGNQTPDGMYPIVTRYLYPPSQVNPGISDYFIDPAQTIPIYFVPGNHEYWMALVNPPVSNDTLTYYNRLLTPDTDFVVTNELAVIVFLRSGSDSTITVQNKKGKGLTDQQCAFLRNALTANAGKRKIIVMHHPAVNAVGTNSDGTPFTGTITGPDDCSIANNRTTFLNICDSNRVDVVLNGHEHQNVVAGRNGHVIPENGSDSTRYVQTAAAFNRSYRIITVAATGVTVGLPQRTAVPAGTGDLQKRPGIAVYPNPASDRVTVECPFPASIEIMTVEGQLLKSLTTNSRTTAVDLAGFSRGLYLVKATTASGTATRKLRVGPGAAP